MRRAAKVDLSQARIVEGLRELGYQVEVIGQPVDLMVQVWSNGPVRGWLWKLLECKTPTKTGKIRKRKDQEKQDAFIERTGTVRVTSLEEAIEALKGW